MADRDKADQRLREYELVQPVRITQPTMSSTSKDSLEVGGNKVLSVCAGFCGPGQGLVAANLERILGGWRQYGCKPPFEYLRPGPRADCRQACQFLRGRRQDGLFAAEAAGGTPQQLEAPENAHLAQDQRLWSKHGSHFRRVRVLKVRLELIAVLAFHFAPETELRKRSVLCCCFLAGQGSQKLNVSSHFLLPQFPKFEI